MNGLLRCAKYAFAPNKLKYCGPDKNQEISAYLTNKASDQGLKELLDDFLGMYPYLKLISRENGISDPFDERVVEAYWLGNELLEAVSWKSFYQQVEKKLAPKELRWFELKLASGVKPNHSFHVFNFLTRTGHRAIPHTVETMDNCRISAGRIVAPGKVKTDKLVCQNGKLKLTPAIKKFHNLVDGFKTGDLVTFHWGWVCEKINRQQAKNLEKYTNLALRLANLTI